MSERPSDDVLLGLNRAATTARLFSGAAHEVNNALQVISGTVEMLLMRTDLSEDLRSALDRVHRQGTRAATALADVQQYTRADLNTPATVNLREAVLQAVELRMFALRRAKVTVETSGAESGLLVHGNRGRLQQAAFNLLINAEQAMTGLGGGTLRIAFGVADGEVSVRIADGGRGIALQPAERVFERFTSSRPAVDGAGLGLWSARRIVEAHGGSLQIEDGAASGTTFAMRLPRAAADGRG